MKPVRLVTFSKSEGRNWSVPWHQDRVIAVDQRAEIVGFTNWGRKGGIWHCEPPAELLSRMLFLRLHLDDCTEENGAMEIAPGSHLSGIVSAAEAETVALSCQTEPTIATQGDVLILSMLTLHRSGLAQSSAPRRVLRVDLSADDLPHPLNWVGYSV